MNAGGQVASIGGGATWVDAYLYLESQGLAVAGGRNAAVGVGGLTIGGSTPTELNLANASAKYFPNRWNILLHAACWLGL